MRDDAERRAAFEAALGGEYFALNGLRASTTAEASTRATIYFTTMSGTLLALGFLAGSTDAVIPSPTPRFRPSPCSVCSRSCG